MVRHHLGRKYILTWRIFILLLVLVESDTAAPAGGTKRGKQGPPGVVGKKKGLKTTSRRTSDKDADGSLRIAGYRGVWVNPAGKHFVKLEGERLKDGDGTNIFFGDTEEAAKRYDEALRASNPQGVVEYNFNKDGTRIVYEDTSKSSTTGLGGGAASVVPALSVINIKVRPITVAL